MADEEISPDTPRSTPSDSRMLDYIANNLDVDSESTPRQMVAPPTPNGLEGSPQPQETEFDSRERGNAGTTIRDRSREVSSERGSSPFGHDSSRGRSDRWIQEVSSASLEPQHGRTEPSPSRRIFHIEDHGGQNNKHTTYNIYVKSFSGNLKIGDALQRVENPATSTTRTHVHDNHSLAVTQTPSVRCDVNLCTVRDWRIPTVECAGCKGHFHWFHFRGNFEEMLQDVRQHCPSCRVRNRRSGGSNDGDSDEPDELTMVDDSEQGHLGENYEEEQDLLEGNEAPGDVVEDSERDGVPAAPRLRAVANKKIHTAWTLNTTAGSGGRQDTAVPDDEEDGGDPRPATKGAMATSIRGTKRKRAQPRGH